MSRPSRIEPFPSDPVFRSLPPADRVFITEKAESLLLSFQDVRFCVDVAADLRMWESGNLADYWDEEGVDARHGRDRKRLVLDRLKGSWNRLKEEPHDYGGFTGEPEAVSAGIGYADDAAAILGRCPVATPRTRCCNLMTLDVVQNCGYGCSYCSIHSFYRGGGVSFHRNLKEKLSALELEPGKVHHLGTGQSSDSLMWGNRYGLLDDLMEFAARNPDVILELKTKSGNVAPLLERTVPRNVIATWSLNTGAVISNEEHLTAPLEDRLSAASRAAAKGILVGFHLHPMVRYAGWREDYVAMIRGVLGRFDHREVAMVSFGTLTYTKPVIRSLRASGRKTRVLRMPLAETGGKLSYPPELKLELFRAAYEAFAPWHGKVFFYLCMEDADLWKQVFGYGYPDNDAFETAMKEAYIAKIRA